jgi:hypothetical protein
MSDHKESEIILEEDFAPFDMLQLMKQLGKIDLSSLLAPRVYQIEIHNKRKRIVDSVEREDGSKRVKRIKVASQVKRLHRREDDEQGAEEARPPKRVKHAADAIAPPPRVHPRKRCARTVNEDDEVQDLSSQKKMKT